MYTPQEWAHLPCGVYKLSSTVCILAWLKDGSCAYDQCPGEDEHVQNEVHALLICQDHRVCELRKHFSFLFTPFFEEYSAAQPFLLQQVNNQLVHDFVSQQNNRLFLFLSKLMDLFVAVDHAKQPGLSTPIVTIVTLYSIITKLVFQLWGPNFRTRVPRLLLCAWVIVDTNW